MDDIERAIDDGVNVYKAITTEQRFVPGAGATEIELARRLIAYAKTIPGLEQYAINAFAEALEVVPRVLAENAGQKAQEVIAMLYVTPLCHAHLPPPPILFHTILFHAPPPPLCTRALPHASLSLPAGVFPPRQPNTGPKIVDQY